VRMTLVDGRSLAISVVRPAAALVWNWTTLAWDPMAAAGPAHIQPFAPVAGAPGPWANLITVELGAAMDTVDAMPVAWQLGAGGGLDIPIAWSTLRFAAPPAWDWP
jgi:hypothetical protein